MSGCLLSSTARSPSGESTGSQYISPRASPPAVSSSRMSSGTLPPQSASAMPDACAPKRDVSAAAETLPLPRTYSSTMSAAGSSFSISTAASGSAYAGLGR